MDKIKLLIIGYGAMGKALHNAWHDIDWLDITVVSPHINTNRDEKLKAFPETKFFTPEELAQHQHKFDYILLAIKPQVIDSVMSFYKGYIDFDRTVVISIAAGININRITDLLGDKEQQLSVVRVMPNTPAQIGEGVAGLFFNKHVKPDDIEKVTKMFEASGKVNVRLNNEDDFHLLTAFTGSGPAYVFYFMESFLESVKSLRLSNDEKLLMCEQLFAGSALYARSMFGKKDLPTLRQEVTSPGGTTQSGLEVLMDGRVKKAISETINAARDKSIELSKK